MFQFIFANDTKLCRNQCFVIDSDFAKSFLYFIYVIINWNTWENMNEINFWMRILFCSYDFCENPVILLQIETNDPIINWNTWENMIEINSEWQSYFVRMMSVKTQWSNENVKWNTKNEWASTYCDKIFLLTQLFRHCYL